MAASNGPVKTILAVIVVFILMVLVTIYLIFMSGQAMAPVRLMDRAPVSTGFHDHRVDHWTNMPSREEHML
jgi:hypothetical protein